jgi:spermidine/putrescine transport system ATP-binding protein
MNVFDNIAFGLVEKKVKKDEIKRRVGEMIKLVQLDGMEKRMPAQMSGGQKQRVAIARALVNQPKVLLLDEPLGALDLKLRKQMQGELKHLQRKLGITFIYVTHDQEEALTMSDRIAVMNQGNLEQVGTPEEIYNHPETKFVADFIGESNIIEGYIENMTDDTIEVTMESGKAVIHESGYRLEEMVYLCVRPENLKISTESVEGFKFRGQVREHVFIGSINKTMIELPNGQMLKAETPAEDELVPVGTVVNVYWNPGKAVVMRTKEEQIYNVIERSVEIEGMTNDQIF